MTYKIVSVGEGTNGWYHIVGNNGVYQTQVRGYSNAIKHVESLEANAPKQAPTNGIDDYINSLLKK